MSHSESRGVPVFPMQTAEIYLRDLGRASQSEAVLSARALGSGPLALWRPRPARVCCPGSGYNDIYRVRLLTWYQVVVQLDCTLGWTVPSWQNGQTPSTWQTTSLSPAELQHSCPSLLRRCSRATCGRSFHRPIRLLNP